MATVNEHFLSLGQRYLFSEIAARVAAYSAAHPKADLIRMGIGDVTQPLAPAVIAAMHQAVEDCAQRLEVRVVRVTDAFECCHSYPIL